MKLNKQKYLYIAIIVAFFALNIFNTYFVTTELLNSYVQPIRRTFGTEVTALLGNLGVLMFFYMIGRAFFKSDKARFIYLIVITFVLNFLIFALGFFNLFYGTSFSTNAFDIFKNPTSGLATGMFGVIASELFLNFRFLVFIPLLLLIVLVILYIKESKRSGNNHLYRLGGIQTLVIVSSFFIFFGGSTTAFVVRNHKDDFNISSLSSTKGVQSYGVYPYYMTTLLGVDFDNNTKEALGINDDNVFERYDIFNKNKNTYINAIDNKAYSNDILLKDSEVKAHDSLNLNANSSLNGIFKDKNLVLVHMESLNQFLWQLDSVDDNLSFVKKLMKESFVFDNYYTSVGLGVSSDAEATVLTGLDMNGYETFYRSYDEGHYAVDALPYLFKDYTSQGFDGVTTDFYDRKNAYKELTKFSEPHYSLESFASDLDYKDINEYTKDRMNNGHKYMHHDKELLLKSPWPTDFEMADKMYEQMEKHQAKGKKQFMLTKSMMPHTPFMYNQMPGYYETDLKISSITKRYLDFTKMVDYSFEGYFVDPKTKEARPNIEDNVYVFYGDHGSSLKNGDLGTLFNKKLDKMEERRMLQQTFAFIYAPSNVKTNELGINEGLIKGNQTRTRGHLDLYRTIGEMFGLFDETNFFFGTSGFSKEPSYVFDNRVQDVVIDDVRNIGKEGYTPLIMSMRNNDVRYSQYGNNYHLDNELNIIKHIKNFKKHSDLLIADGFVYESYKKTLQKN
ncbi:MAG TPA: hypothetical protein VJ845_01695 [Haploplasma sp.]|nr:hypothetical protein [Haploplasma sp.]